MTTKNSICMKCAHLYAYTIGVCYSGGVYSLISHCMYGGKNAGNRKTCKCFEKAEERIIKERESCFIGKEDEKRY